MTPSISQSDVLTALGDFLAAVLPGTEIVVGQPNRVPEPKVGSFVVMTPIRWRRLETNVDDAADVKFTGSIALGVLTVTDVEIGVIQPGAAMFGVGLAAGTSVGAQITGVPGGIGTYAVAPSQVVGSETMASGAKTVELHVEWTIQLDLHSADNSAAAMSQTVSALLRDPFGVDFFRENHPGVAPLYADDPVQMAFVNAEAQYEWRWVLSCCLQSNPTISAPQQYADLVEVDLVNVEAVYSP